MTPREAIIGRINKGPAALCDLACEVHLHCIIAPCDMYAVTYSAVNELLASHRIVKHECGAYMLPSGVQFETTTDDAVATPKLRPGTAIPKRYRHLVA